MKGKIRGGLSVFLVLFLQLSFMVSASNQESLWKTKGFEVMTGQNLSEMDFEFKDGAGSSEIPELRYMVRMLDEDWLQPVSAGGISGNEKEPQIMEGFRACIKSKKDLGIRYRISTTDYGWESDWNRDGCATGFQNKRKKIEAIKIELTGEDAKDYSIYYRMHVPSFGWLGWARDGEIAGTTKYGKTVNAIQVVLRDKTNGFLLEKGYSQVENSIKNNSQKSHKSPKIRYTTCLEDTNWQEFVYDGDTSGRAEESAMVNAIHVKLLESSEDGTIEYRVSDGNEWNSWVQSDEVSGTTLVRKIQMRCTGQLADKYDIYYRTYVGGDGWLAYAKNGEEAGTLIAEQHVGAIQVILQKKDDGSLQEENYPLPALINEYRIMGKTQISPEQMSLYYKKAGNYYPESYQAKGASTIDDFCEIVAREAEKEGVKAEVVFAQILLETAHLRFGGDVSNEQCNFGGLGASGGVPGLSFSDVNDGVRSQVQHLKAYACEESFNEESADRRFHFVKRGCAPFVRWLGVKENPFGVGWAEGEGYGDKIMRIICKMKNVRRE